MTSKTCDQIDHFAVRVKNIQQAVDWYTSQFACTIEYQDETWAVLKFANVKLAFVVPEQHPAHIAFIKEDADSFGKLKEHRDGTRSTYIKDPAGNAIEIMTTEKAKGNK